MTAKDGSTATPLTRTEVAAATSSAFGPRSVARTVLLECAQRSGSRPEVVAALERLPDRESSDLRQVWADLPDMAVR